jgi:hypothetical protein
MSDLETIRNVLNAKGNVFYVDPPTGWMFGFPKVIDLSKETLDEDWLVAKGYPKRDVDFALNHVRIWEKYD